MTDAAVCEWKRIHPGHGTPLDFWMGQMIQHCDWEPREEPLVCPEGVTVPEPREVK